ncbi:isochorismatase family protein [Streptomyces sp. NBC_01197]|uniref:isochorismatase family protein n=1 Tax=Streptomyces sp. NBC_01197 TaxID=2903768 RepID=UPI002E11A48E|nr:cysteine hydrolase [Streptomyces sp. NBC_01197]
MSTSSGVESTARSAADHGYHVVLATDAITDPDAEAHRHSLGRVFPSWAKPLPLAKSSTCWRQRDDPAGPAPEEPQIRRDPRGVESA